MDNTFGNRLKELRLSYGLTCEEFGKQMGVSKVSEWQWENSINYPNQDTLLKIADYFNVSIDYLLGRSDIKKITPITEDDFLVAFSGLSSDLTEEQKKQMLDIANSLVVANKVKK